ncbi:hypothetical protein AYR66_22435 [Noviherbaspirillum denitrificans]|uniref:DUF2141 domain-containing protein n=2 Tax=Noviherbaspirillum denitrificans TaxID=1968433 RepID=A0A254TGQ7_9BURK|nr:hypothetical protein AYR66_22435 [Noviherbaspirillum denitrificans]
MIRALALLVAFGLWSAALTGQPLKQQTNNKDAVTVKVTPLKVEGAVWEFEIVFDTHSQDLSDDLLNAAVLVGPDGSQIKPAGWNGDPPSGHHRKGVLRFNALNPPPDVLELRIARPKEPTQRAFKWTMPRQ